MYVNIDTQFRHIPVVKLHDIHVFLYTVPPEGVSMVSKFAINERRTKLYSRHNIYIVYRKTPLNRTCPGPDKNSILEGILV